jgi:hypothetical protein
MPRPSDKIIQQKKNRATEAAKSRSADSVATVVLGKDQSTRKSLKDSVKTFDLKGKPV